MLSVISTAIGYCATENKAGYVKRTLPKRTAVEVVVALVVLGIFFAIAATKGKSWSPETIEKVGKGFQGFIYYFYATMGIGVLVGLGVCINKCRARC